MKKEQVIKENKFQNEQSGEINVALTKTDNKDVLDKIIENDNDESIIVKSPINGQEKVENDLSFQS